MLFFTGIGLRFSLKHDALKTMSLIHETRVH